MGKGARKRCARRFCAPRLRFGSVSPALEQIVQALTREDELMALFDRTIKAWNEADLTLLK